MQHLLYIQKLPVFHSVKANVATNAQSSLVTSKNYKTLHLIIPMIFFSASPQIFKKRYIFFKNLNLNALNLNALILKYQGPLKVQNQRYILRQLLVYAKKEKTVLVGVLSRVKQRNNLVKSVAWGNGDRKKTCLSVTLEK